MASLSQRKMRRKHGLFIIEGRKSVEDILFSYPGRFHIEYIAATPEWLSECGVRAIAMVKAGEEAIYEASAADLRGVSSLSTPPDVMAVCALPEQTIEDDIALSADELYLMLDGVQDPGNLGTIVRTAHWFGIKRIFASRTTADIYNPKAIQSSMGSLAAVRVSYVDLPAIVRANPDIPVAGLQLEGRDIFRSVLPKGAFIVMGNEGNGLSAEMRSLITLPLTIPPYDASEHAESLNVAIATGITLAEFRKSVRKM